jgi:hypothetical protein
VTSDLLARLKRSPARLKQGPGALASWLTRGRLIAILVALVAVAAITVLIAVFARGWWQDQGGSYAPKAIVSATQITPTSSLFGDVLTARAEVTVDPRRFDPASVQLDPNFAPYVIRSQTRGVEPGLGRATVVAFSYSIECLTESCIGLMSQKAHKDVQAKTVSFQPATLTATPVGGTGVTEHVAWPPIVVHSRLSAAQIALSTPVIDPTPSLPAVSWAITPNLLGAVTITAAVLLIIVASWLVATIALGDSKLLIRRISPARHLSPIERALRLAEHASANGELEEERKALERLAVELRLAGRGDLAGRAGRLAWSEETPSSGVVEALADAVRSNGAR